jgi:hypothetical protein
MSANELTLGLILLKEGKITKDQLKKALLKQGEIRRFGRAKRLGEVVATLGFLPEEEVEAAAQLQESLLIPSARHTALGLLLIEAGLLTPSQVYQALIEQQGSDKRLGEILIEQGVLTEAQLQPLLAKQAEERSRAEEALQTEMKASGLIQEEDEFVLFDFGSDEMEAPAG